MFRHGFLVFFILIGFQQSFAQRACRAYFKLTAVESLASVLQHGGFSFDEPTVDYKGQKDQRILLEKQKDSAWTSGYNPSSEGFNVHGDPRTPIFVFGLELSKKMGFEVRVQADGSTALAIPNPKRFKNFVDRTNAVLMKDGRQPISYLPVEFGYASAKEMLELSIAGGKEFEMLFPFADKDPRIVAHEVAFHLGSMILPRGLLARARRLTERSLQMARLFQDGQNGLGDVGVAIYEQLMKDRSVELDFGTADSTDVLRNARQRHSMAEYTKALDVGQLDQHVLLSKALNYLARPTLSPARATVERMIRMLRLESAAAEILGDSLPTKFNDVVTGFGHGVEIQLSPEQKLLAVQAIKYFYQRYGKKDASDFGVIDPRQLAKNFVNSLDERIREINEAATTAGF